MKVLITGSGGQLGRELLRSAPSTAAVTAWNRATLDIANADQAAQMISALAPALIINAAAYTAVDAAETDVAGARAGNVDGAGNLADIAARLGAQLLHVSTDYVFGGSGSARIFQPDDPVAPLGVYGRTKAEGEERVLRCAPRAIVVRTSWMYSRFGKNFVKTVLQLCQTRPRVRIVADQVGAPTWAAGLARCLWQLAGRNECRGIRHYCDAGVASWYDFAVAIRDEALALGLIGSRTPIDPIRSDEFPAKAPRPTFSVLDARALRDELGLEALHWRSQLQRMLAEIGTGDD
jgi:dTDP-4-dehydrorhamnose reductase